MKSILLSALTLSVALGGARASAQDWQPRSSLAPCFPGSPSGALQTYASYENEMLQWYSRYRSAPSGSNEEQFARERMQFNGDRALGALVGYGAFSGYAAIHIEVFAQESDQKYRSASSGSYTEGFYLRVRNQAWDAFVQQNYADFQCGDAYTWDTQLQLGEQSYRQYRSAQSGSKAEAAYLNVAQGALNSALSRLQNAINAGAGDSRTFENTGVQFEQRYYQAPSGSVLETFFRDAAQTAFNGSLQRFQQEVFRLPTQSLYSLASEYASKERSARSGSAYERYARDMQYAAQNEINRRGSDPRPPYPPRPPRPQPPGNVSCQVTTSRGTYPGYGSYKEQALANARSECIKYENSGTCLNARFVCRGL